MTYLKADKKQVKYKITLPHDLLSLTHTQGKRWVLQKVTATFSEALEKLRWRVFEGVRETFLIHQLKKLLSTEARNQLRKNLTDCGAIVYSDLIFFIPDISELSPVNPKEIKHAAFGASNTTIQIVPQVGKL